jgi:hypothetical protein
VNFHHPAETLLSDYADFGDEFAQLMALEISDADASEKMPDADLLPSILDAVEDFLSNVECGGEKRPAEIGAIEDYSRKSLIFSALVLAVAKALRRCRRKSPKAIAMLLYIAFRSDNGHGRCKDSVSRIADYLGCSEDVVRDLRQELVKCGALRAEACPGQPAALWLPYVAAACQYSAHSILSAIAPPRQAVGRPRKVRTDKTPGIRRPTISVGKTPGLSRPTFSEKPRVLDEKTPGVESENPGYLMPDSKNSSLQDLNTRTKEAVVAAHARVLPQPPCIALNVSKEVGHVVVADENIAFVLNHPLVNLQRPSSAQRAKVAATLTKALLQWKVPGKPHQRYATFEDWFIANWMPGLRQDLEKLADADQPRRFTEKLESTIVFEAKANQVHYGSQPKKCSITRLGVNDASNKADIKYFGGRPFTRLIDFENGKLEARSQERLPEAIAKAALQRVHGDDAIEIFPSEQQTLEKQLAADGFLADDVKRILREFSEQVSLGLRHKNHNFPINVWLLLFQRETFIERSLAYLRAALRRVADERQAQKAEWLRYLPKAIAGAEADKRNPNVWKRWTSSAAYASKDAFVAHVSAGLGTVFETDIQGAMVRANALAEQYVQTHADETVAFLSGTDLPDPPEPFQFRWDKIDAYPDPFATAVSEVADR